MISNGLIVINSSEIETRTDKLAISDIFLREVLFTVECGTILILLNWFLTVLYKNDFKRFDCDKIQVKSTQGRIN